MSVIRATSLTYYPRLVAELGGDPAKLLRAAGVRAQDIGKQDVFVPLQGVVQAVESAAATTHTPDFGRRLAQWHDIEFLGPVGVAARTAATLADAVAIFETFMAVHSPALLVRVTPLSNPERKFLEFQFPSQRSPSPSQSMELFLGVTFKLLRLLLGPQYTPLSVHVPHEPLTPAAEYLRYFGCTPYFAEPRAGFTLRTDDLTRPLNHDEMAHRAVVEYLATLVRSHQPGLSPSVRTIARQLLPTGAATLEVIATQFNLHPKTLQRRLAAEGTSFSELLDGVRRAAAEHYLRDTHIELSHLARELGYTEQSVLTRSCKRWFGTSPTTYRRAVRSTRQPAGANL